MTILNLPSLPAHPLVSIITVVYNGERYLKDTIDSITKQDYKNIEYIIVDGESEDQTPAIIKERAPTNTTWIREKDNGIYDAMNKGISAAKGDIIGLLNSDDWYEDNAISSVVKAMQANPKAGLVYGAMANRNQKDELMSIYYSKETTPDILSAPFNHPTCFVRSDVYRQIGLFDTKYKTAADYDWMLRFKNQEIPYLYLNTVLTNFRLTGVTGGTTYIPVNQIASILKKNKIQNKNIAGAIFYRILLSWASYLTSHLPSRLQEKLKNIPSYKKT